MPIDEFYTIYNNKMIVMLKKHPKQVKILFPSPKYIQ